MALHARVRTRWAGLEQEVGRGAPVKGLVVAPGLRLMQHLAQMCNRHPPTVRLV